MGPSPGAAPAPSRSLSMTRYRPAVPSIVKPELLFLNPSGPTEKTSLPPASSVPNVALIT